MKRLYLTIILGVCFNLLHAQTDTVIQPNAEYIKYIKHPGTNAVNLSYDYTNKWDLDGDGKMDAVYFIGNGGAHTYFFLRVVLSTDNKTRNFPFIQLDMPYITSRNLPKILDTGGTIQFMPGDFDSSMLHLRWVGNRSLKQISLPRTTTFLCSKK
jgi:hypothetical protein